jgi:hypothetical protein
VRSAPTRPTTSRCSPLGDDDDDNNSNLICLSPCSAASQHYQSVHHHSSPLACFLCSPATCPLPSLFAPIGYKSSILSSAAPLLHSRGRERERVASMAAERETSRAAATGYQHGPPWVFKGRQGPAGRFLPSVSSVADQWSMMLCCCCRRLSPLTAARCTSCIW